MAKPTFTGFTTNTLVRSPSSTLPSPPISRGTTPEGRTYSNEARTVILPDGSVPSFRVHSKVNSYRNCVISNSEAAAATSASPTHNQQHSDYYYQPRSAAAATVVTADMKMMPQATNMSINPSSDNDNDAYRTEFSSAVIDSQRRPFSMRFSMPFRTAFAQHGNLRSELFNDGFFDDIFPSGLDRQPLSLNHDDSGDLFSGLSNRGSSLSSPVRDSSSMERQVISHPIRRLSSSDEEYNWQTSVPREGLEENLIQHIIHSEAPDQLQQRVKIFIAQDRARGLGSSSNNVARQDTSFPRFSARLPHGGSLSFSFSTSSNSSTLHINDGSESGQVPPHAMLTIEQKRQLKQRLLAHKQDLISGPNTSATILTSDDVQSVGGSPKGQANPGSVAERVMWFEGVPQLQISHHPPGRLQRSAAHIALQNWRNGISESGDAGWPQRPPSVERTIPIIREADVLPATPAPYPGSKPNTNAISITLEVPAKQNARIGGVDALTPSKPGNHIVTAASVSPQTAVISDLTSKTPISVQTASTKGFDNKPLERIIPTILPSPEPKPVDRKLYADREARDLDTKTPAQQSPDSRDARSIKSPEIQKASENIIKALQNGMKREELKEEATKVLEKSVPPKPKSISPPKIPSPPTVLKEHVPQFHYPRGKPTKAESEYVLMEKVRKAFGAKSELKLDEMKELVMALSLPFYWRKPLLLAAVANGPPRETITFDLLWNAWKRITANCHDEASRFVCLLAKPGCHYLLPNDFIPLIQDVVDTHPGLNILKEAPEFHARYTNTVIARIFFCVNRSWSGRITIEELRRSNFLRVLSMLEHEDDINVITEYFSYEHFYVIYCKFWELDRDHDLLIDKADLARHNDHAISSKMIDRIFSGAVTRGPSQKEGKMSYTEFVWFLISEEDKRHPTSIEYWFRCMDIDGDGVLSLFELEYFYSEQLQRMKSLGIEALPFEDIACQMLDMVHPKHKNRILLKDLKRCRMTCPLFFDTFFNIEKYLLHEHRDPFASAKVDVEDNEPISDWDRYAAEEYEILVSEDAASEDL